MIIRNLFKNLDDYILPKILKLFLKILRGFGTNSHHKYAFNTGHPQAKIPSWKDVFLMAIEPTSNYNFLMIIIFL